MPGIEVFEKCLEMRMPKSYLMPGIEVFEKCLEMRMPKSYLSRASDATVANSFLDSFLCK
jgi:hypothetical protein